jgi:predicted Rossmann fold flavoprotein
MVESQPPVLVIGGGGAGLLAAWRCASLGVPVHLLERNPQVGVKLLISGGGKCNVTHAGSIEEVRSAFLPREGRFLRHAFHRFSNSDLIALLEQEQVKTFARPNGRVFPLSGRARDVAHALVKLCVRAGARIECGARVEGIRVVDGRVAGVSVNGEQRPASRVIVATGGCSYRKTGTTGDGLRWAAETGHTIVPIRAALAPIRVPLPHEWQGVALRGGKVSVRSGDRVVESRTDDILFTHEGVSGPGALAISRSAAVALETGPVTLVLDCAPSLDHDALDKTLQSIITRERGKMIGTVLDVFLPNRLVPFLCGVAGVDPATRVYALTREARKAIARCLKEWTIGSIEEIPLDRGEVSAGGVSLDHVDPRTMFSRRMPGLSFVGEVLDIAGPIGGYNLQAAFSTGYVAGEEAAKEKKNEDCQL